jgi:toxin-antitoxin system PIN domain toxin
MRHLCDANIWVSLTLQQHEFRPQCLAWYKGLGASDTLAFCRSTQQSFLRLMTKKSVCQDEVRTNREALEGYKLLRESSRIEWLEEPYGLEALWSKYASLNSVSPNIWMDAYLAAFAVLSNARLVTFDKGFRVYKGLDWIDLNQPLK